jgi:hypothetical protein
VLVGVDEDGEHTVSATPLRSTAAANQTRLTSSRYLPQLVLARAESVTASPQHLQPDGCCGILLVQ